MRVRNRWIVALISVALLSMQWAAAAHACQAPLSSIPGSHPAHAGGCAGAHVAPMKAAQSLPCTAHCSIDDQSSGAAGVDSAAVASCFPRTWFTTGLLDTQRPAGAMALAVDAGPPAGTPPIYLSQRSLLN